MLVTKEARQVDWRAVVRSAPATIEVPIARATSGDIYVNVAFLKDDRLYRAEKRVKVPAAARQLQVTVAADQPVAKPRQPAAFTVTVRDQAGRPVRAQLSVGVIDEAVYGVKPDDTADPLRFFYRRDYSRVGTDVLARLLVHRLLGHRAAAARPAPPADDAGRLQGRQADAAAGAQGVPGRHLLDAATW